MAENSKTKYSRARVEELIKKLSSKSENKETKKDSIKKTDKKEVKDEKKSNIDYSDEELKVIYNYIKENLEKDKKEEAKEKLKDGKYQVINGETIFVRDFEKDFPHKVKYASKELKDAYNKVKNEIMKYSNVENKTNKQYDMFYIGNKMIAKISFGPTFLRIFLNLNSADYSERQFPHEDYSNKKVHEKTPFYMKAKSELSIKRFKNLMLDIAKNNNLEENKEYKTKDYTIKYRRIK